jgi:hypothetical protein
MPKGSCDGSTNPDGLNHQILRYANNTILVDIAWTWDGVSQYPACEGPVNWVRVANTGTETWTVRIPRAGKVGGRTYSLLAGVDVTLSDAVLKTRGYELLSQVEDLSLTLG